MNGKIAWTMTETLMVVVAVMAVVAVGEATVAARAAVKEVLVVYAPKLLDGKFVLAGDVLIGMSIQ